MCEAKEGIQKSCERDQKQKSCCKQNAD